MTNLPRSTQNSNTQNTTRTIEVTDVARGTGDILATCTARIGGVTIRGVTVRRGRGNATYINYPSRKDSHGRWLHLVVITSPGLEAAVRDAVLRAVSEVTR